MITYVKDGTECESTAYDSIVFATGMASNKGLADSLDAAVEATINL